MKRGGDILLCHTCACIPALSVCHAGFVFVSSHQNNKRKERVMTVPDAGGARNKLY